MEKIGLISKNRGCPPAPKVIRVIIQGRAPKGKTHASSAENGTDKRIFILGWVAGFSFAPRLMMEGNE